MTVKGNPIMVLVDIEKRSKSTTELLQRLNDYGQVYQSMRGTEEAKLVIFASYTNHSTYSELRKNFEYLEIYSIKSRSWQVLRQMRFLLRMIKNEKNHSRLLIAGDPVLGFLITFMAKLFSFNRHSMQVQFHGDIYKRPKEFGFKVYLRWVLARFQILIATSIRVVSQHQAIEISNFNSSSRRNIVVAPIPIDHKFYSTRLDKKRTTLGFIGRLHAERGMDLLQEIIAKVMIFNPNLNIHVIGDGPERINLEHSLKQYIDLNRVLILGWQNHEEIIAELEQVKIVLSTAPFEGYGLAIREAVLSGAQVVAKESGGAREAKIDFPNSVYIYNDVEGAIRLISERMKLDLPNASVIQARNRQSQLDRRSTEALVKSWY